jgi:hypothetical protein
MDPAVDAPNGGSGASSARKAVTQRDGSVQAASLLVTRNSWAVPFLRLVEAVGQFTDVTGADQLAHGG